MDLEKLKELGLSKGQVAVYSAILELGVSTINAIHEKTGMERRAIYDIINKLIERGYVSYTIERGKRTFQCTHPNKLLEDIQVKEKGLRELEAQIPELNSLLTAPKLDIRAEVYRGDEGIKALFNEVLDYKESYYLGGNSFDEYKRVNKGLELWFHHWMIRRAKKKRIMRDLVDYGTHLQGLEPGNISVHKTNYYKYCQLPKQLRSPLVIIIFGNKVAQVLWGKQPFAFVLESPEIKESFLKYFMYFWKEPW